MHVSIILLYFGNVQEYEPLYKCRSLISTLKTYSFFSNTSASVMFYTQHIQYTYVEKKQESNNKHNGFYRFFSNVCHDFYASMSLIRTSRRRRHMCQV